MPERGGGGVHAHPSLFGHRLALLPHRAVVLAPLPVLVNSPLGFSCLENPFLIGLLRDQLQEKQDKETAWKGRRATNISIWLEKQPIANHRISLFLKCGFIQGPILTWI